MIEILLNKINSIHSLPSEVIKEFKDSWEVKKYKSGDYLCEIGQINNKNFFVLDGIIRTYMQLGSGSKVKEINKSLAAPGQVVSSVKSATTKTPADIACQALTEATIVEISYDDLNTLIKKYPEFCVFMYKFSIAEYLRLEEAHINLLSKDATERYLILRKNIKNIDQLIPQFQIASHLGITPIQLSRIRRKLLRA